MNANAITKIEPLNWPDIGDPPKVSIIIPVYNGAKYIRDAIDSALAQTYKNIEVIVVNDGSTDDGETERIALSYGDKIRYFRKENGGVATALNYGIEKMTGDYFSWLSHDDMYTRVKIEGELRALAIHRNPTTIVAEGYQIVNSKGKQLFTTNLHDLYPEKRLKNSMFLVLRGGVNGCALLIHKSHFLRVGFFDPALPTTQDYDLWFRMFRGQKVLYLRSANVLSRSHAEQGSKTMSGNYVAECDRLWIKMAESLTMEEKVEISGSEYRFYRELHAYLRSTSNYQGAISHMKEQEIRAAIAEYKGTRTLRDICRFSAFYAADTINGAYLLCLLKKAIITWKTEGFYTMLKRIVLRINGRIGRPD